MTPKSLLISIGKNYKKNKTKQQQKKKHRTPTHSMNNNNKKIEKQIPKLNITNPSKKTFKSMLIIFPMNADTNAQNVKKKESIIFKEKHSCFSSKDLFALNVFKNDSICQHS